MPSVEETSDKGELRTLTQLVIDLCEVCYHIISLVNVSAELLVRNLSLHFLRLSWIRLAPMSFVRFSSSCVRHYSRPMPPTKCSPRCGPKKVQLGKPNRVP